MFIIGTKTLKVDFSGVLWGVNFRQGFISTWMREDDPEADGKPHLVIPPRDDSSRLILPDMSPDKMKRDKSYPLFNNEF